MLFYERSQRVNCSRSGVHVDLKNFLKAGGMKKRIYAIIETGGKQYKVQEGDVLKVEKLKADVDSVVKIDKVLAISSDDGFVVGKPYVDGAYVEAKVLEHAKDKKIIVFTYKSKTGYHRKLGHRQWYTKIQITKIAK